MYGTIFLAALTLLSPTVNAADANADDGSCKLPTPAQAFSASIYTALFLTTDPEIANSLKISGGEAGMKLYTVIKKDLEGFGVCNADGLAFAGAHGLANVETLTLLDFLDQVSKTIANVLYGYGLLDCDNDLSRSLDLYSHIKKAFEGLDPSTFEAQFQGIVHGVNTFYLDLGLALGDANRQTADEFKSRISNAKPDDDKCKAANASN